MFGVFTVSGGSMGTILLGGFASKAVDTAGTDGLIYGGAAFFGKQVIAVSAASACAFIFTNVMLASINRIPEVRVSEEEVLQGLDVALHVEKPLTKGLRNMLLSVLVF